MNDSAKTITYYDCCKAHMIVNFGVQIDPPTKQMWEGGHKDTFTAVIVAVL